MGPHAGTPRLRFDANLMWLFTELPFGQRFDAAAAAGFEAVEITAPYPYSTGALSGWLADAGLDLVLINTPGGDAGSPTAFGSACHPEGVADFRAGIPVAIEYAVALGNPVVHLMAGIVPDAVAPDLAYATYLENLAWAVDQIEQTDLTLVVEVLNQRDRPGFVLGSERQAVEAIEAVGSSRVRLLFDFYHVQVNEGDVSRVWREVSPMVGHIQIGDPPGRHEPGTGELRWEYLFDEIAGSGYDGWIGCEYNPIADTESGLDWYRPFASGHDATTPPGV